jgi:hypothetical protein
MTSEKPGHWRKKDRPSSVTFWKEKEFFKGKQIDAGVVILRTCGCSHFNSLGGCSMCGFNLDSRRDTTPEQVLRQFESAANGLGDVQLLKVYTSGSFLDEREIAREVASEILNHCKDRGIRLLFESRPEYVTDENIERIQGAHDNLQVALGLESTNDRILTYSINKGFCVRDYDRAAGLIHDRGVPIRTYVLLKPPYLTESEALDDASSTVKYAARYGDAISINPVNVQRGTLVERLWRNWAYRPPWLWSVLELVKSTRELDKQILCDPVGGGRERGSHNCGKCDEAILHGLKAFSTTQDYGRLGSPECSCKETWHGFMDIEELVLGGTCDLERFFRSRN